ncbi:MAG: alpha/beta fold hydrolase [Candidatus Rokubacteria bacterium]|nr:alpha/beta fold hydrolase [Candidatus Rokubacteria bacterium]MBI3104101.1 alpha/beta fold hydrolase [Candidatus Rokubacteria bacterium]
MPEVRVNDVEIFYQQVGPEDGVALVLIMGWGGDHTAWAFQVPAFSAQYRVVLLDNRGAGQSAQPDSPYTISGMAADTVGLLDALGIARAHVHGMSMGGMIAQEIALSHPARVLTLGLHGTLPQTDPFLSFRGDGMLRVRAQESRETFARMMLAWVLSPKTVAEKPGLVDLLIQRAVDNPYPTSLVGLRRQADAIGRWSSLERLSQIRVPTLITTGADDIMVPPGHSRALQARIPQADLVVIPDAGHLHPIEQPEAFNRAALAFLARHPSS